MAIQQSLQGMGFIKPVTVDRKKLFELTVLAQDYLAGLGYKISQSHKSQGLEHRYFADRVAGALSKQGWQVTPEKHDIDLMALRNEQGLAIEIETGSNNQEQYAKNLSKLLTAKVSHRLILATNHKALIRAQSALGQLSGQQAASIQLLTVKAFLKHPSF